VSNIVASAQRPVRPGWTLALVSVAAFLTSLDVMVVVTALPTIQKELHASLADLEWTVRQRLQPGVRLLEAHRFRAG
jgi:MFS family permease